MPSDIGDASLVLLFSIISGVCFGFIASSALILTHTYACRATGNSKKTTQSSREFVFDDVLKELVEQLGERYVERMISNDLRDYYKSINRLRLTKEREQATQDSDAEDDAKDDTHAKDDAEDDTDAENDADAADAADAEDDADDAADAEDDAE